MVYACAGGLSRMARNNLGPNPIEMIEAAGETMACFRYQLMG